MLVTDLSDWNDHINWSHLIDAGVKIFTRELHLQDALELLRLRQIREVRGELPRVFHAGELLTVEEP